jgi:dTDP-4-dehydrorhamnose reductase
MQTKEINYSSKFSTRRSMKLLKPKTVLIFGASGFLGTELCAVLKANGIGVVTAGRNAMNYYTVALGDYDALRAAIERVRPHAVVNLVALTDVNLCERNPKLAYESNVGYLHHLVELSHTYAYRIIHLSTDQVYGGIGPHLEAEEPRPQNEYGRSKLKAEKLLNLERDLVFRTNFIGKSRARGKPSWTDWLVSSLSASREIKLRSRANFTPLHVSDVCWSICQAIQHELHGLYNLGCAEGVEKVHLAREIARALDLEADLIQALENDASAEYVRRADDLALDSSSYEKRTGLQLPKVESVCDRVIEEYI